MTRLEVIAIFEQGAVVEKVLQSEKRHPTSVDSKVRAATVDHEVAIGPDEKCRPKSVGFYEPDESEWVWETDADLRFIFVSDAFFRMIGVNRSHVIGVEFDTAFAEAINKHPKWQKLREDFRNRRPVRNFEIRPRDFKNRVRYLQMSASPVHDDAGEFLGYRGVMVEITAVRTAEKKALRSRDRYQLLAETGGDVLFEVDVDSRIQYIEGPFLTRRGVDAESAIGRDLFEFLNICKAKKKYELSWEVSRDSFSTVAAIRKGYCCIENSDGQVGYFALNANPILDRDRLFGGYSGLLRDITREVSTVHQLESSEVRFRGLIEDSVDPIYLRNGNELVMVNGALCDLLGYTDPDVLTSTKKFSDLIAEDDRILFLQYLEDEQGHNSVPKNQRLRLLHNDGLTVPTEVSGRYLDWNGAMVRQGLVKDLSGIIASEDALRKSEARFKSFAQIAADWYWETDHLDRFTVLSSRLEEVIGVSSESWIGRTRWEMINNDESGDETTYIARMNELKTCVDQREEFRDFEYPLINVAGDEVFVEISGRPCFENGVFMGYRGTGRDITDAYRMRRKIEHDATHDSLTDLVNRQEFKRQLSNCLNARQSGSGDLVCFLDLDRFKTINDVAGHGYGDLALIEVANLIKGAVGQNSVTARFGGDEFALLLMPDSPDDALEMTREILDAISRFRLQFNDREFTLGASMGVVALDDLASVDELSCESVIKLADESCYFAKNIGRNCIHFYEPVDVVGIARSDAGTDSTTLARIFGEAKLELFGQPVMDWSEETVEVSMVHARVRGEYEGASLNSGELTRIASRYGMSFRLDRWMFEKAVSIWTSHFAACSYDRSPILSINASTEEFERRNYVEFIEKLLVDRNMPASKLCIVLSGSVRVRSGEDMSRKMTAMRELGCLMGLDGFGSETTSLAMLATAAVDIVKLDSACSSKAPETPLYEGLVNLGIQMSEQQNFKLIATGVDTAQSSSHVRGLGICLGEGVALGSLGTLDDVCAQQAEESGSPLASLSVETGGQGIRIATAGEL